MNNFSIKLTKKVGKEQKSDIEIKLGIVKESYEKFERSLEDKYNTEDTQVVKRAPYPTYRGNWERFDITNKKDSAKKTYCYSYDCHKKLGKNKCLLVVEFTNYSTTDYDELFGFILYSIALYAKELYAVLDKCRKLREPKDGDPNVICVEARTVDTYEKDDSIDDSALNDFIHNYLTALQLTNHDYLVEEPDILYSDSCVTWHQTHMYLPARYPEDVRGIQYNYTPYKIKDSENNLVDTDKLFIVTVQDYNKLLPEDFVDHILLDTLYLSMLYGEEDEKNEQKND